MSQTRSKLMFTQINDFNKKYMLILILFMMGNINVAYAEQGKSKTQSDGNQINGIYELLLTYDFLKLKVVDSCQEFQLECIRDVSQDMLDIFYEENVENSIEFKVTKIQTQSMDTYFLTASKEETLSWLNLTVTPSLKAEEAEITIRRISKLDSKHFWIEFDESYMTSGLENTKYNTTWYASIVTFNDLNEMQYKLRKIPIMKQTSYREHVDGSDDVDLEKQKINVEYSKGTIKVTKKTTKINLHQAEWLGTHTLKLSGRRR